MSEFELCLVAIAALVGSAITAIAGLGGGILLLSVLLQFLDPLEAIPIHAVIQLASNSSRAVMLRDDVDWAVVKRFALLLLPAGLAGLLVAEAFPVAVGRIFIALLAIGVASVLLGTWFGTHMLKRLSEVIFGHLFRFSLTAISLRVIISAVLD